MMSRYILITLAVLWFVGPDSVQAETVVRTGDSVAIAASEVVENDYYVGATTIVQSGKVLGDMYAVGGSVTINGSVETDVTAIGARIDIAGRVGDDVRIIAGETVLSGEIAGDVFVIGGTLNLLSTATVAGDVYVFGGDVTIGGAVGGSVLGRAERVRVDAPVAGAIDIVARQGLTLGSRAQVAGDVSYRSARTLVRAPEAIVEGAITAQSVPVTDTSNSLTDRLLPTLVMLFGSLVLYLCGRSFMSAVVQQAQTLPLRSFVIGAAVYLLSPIVAVLLMLTVLGLVVGLGVLGLFVVVLAFSFSVAPMVLGVMLWSRLGGQKQLQPFAILLGVAAVQLLFLVPYVGAISVLTLSMLAAGAVTNTAATRLFRR